MNRLIHNSFKVLGNVVLLLVLTLHSPPVVSCSCYNFDGWGFLSSDGQIPKNAAGILWWGNFNPLRKEPSVRITISTPSGQAIPIEYKYWHSFIRNYDCIYRGCIKWPIKNAAEQYTVNAPDWSTGRHESEWFSENINWFAKNKFIKKIDGKWVALNEARARLINSHLWLFRPEGGFKVGATYIFTASGPTHLIGTTNKSVTVSVSDVSLDPLTEKVPIKSSLPSNGIVSVPAGGSCFSEYQALISTVSMSLPDEYAKFNNFLYFETIIDRTQSSNGRIWHPPESMCDVPIPGQSKIGKGKDVIHGARTVLMRAYLPGTEVMIETPSIDLLHNL